MGLSELSIAETAEKALENVWDCFLLFSAPKTRGMVSKYGPVVIQKFLAGREFTVAVSDHRDYIGIPVERIFDEGQRFSGPEGTKRERLVDDDPALVARIQHIALLAYRSVKGSGYGRVDLRQDSETGTLYVLEVNHTCSVAHNSYFAISLEAGGGTRVGLFRRLLSPLL